MSNNPYEGFGDFLKDLPEKNVRSKAAKTMDAPVELPCGCVPHKTRMTNWGFYCDTEQQGYCNFECPHEDEDHSDSSLTVEEHGNNKN